MVDFRGPTWTYKAVLISTLSFAFQLVLKIQEIFDSRRGKKKVKLVTQTGKEASPAAKGIDSWFSAILFAGQMALSLVIQIRCSFGGLTTYFRVLMSPGVYPIPVK